MTGFLGDGITGFMPKGREISPSSEMTFVFIYLGGSRRTFAIELTRVNKRRQALNFLPSLYGRKRCRWRSD
jgi:hypothetical protein